jgi:DNA-binding transcriptional ArsR family regulator
MLNLTHLKVLEAVARHGSVTEAAKELHYSQPSVSHHLGRLEAATGARLIQRVGRGIRLTPEGELLAGRAATKIIATPATPSCRHDAPTSRRVHLAPTTPERGEAVIAWITSWSNVSSCSEAMKSSVTSVHRPTKPSSC